MKISFKGKDAYKKQISTAEIKNGFDKIGGRSKCSYEMEL